MLAGCANNDSPASRGSTGLYVNYRIWGEEGRENVNGLFQFKPFASSARTLTLEPPAGVQLDGKELQADSTPLTGAYYEVQQPLASFSGSHTIVFTDSSGKKHQETFEYQPFRLINTLPETLSRNGISLQLEGLNEGDSIRVVVVDTSFNTNGINELRAVTDGKVVISREQLNDVASGPITLQLIKEEERPVKNLPQKGGHISISYKLTRELELKD